MPILLKNIDAKTLKDLSICNKTKYIFTFDPLLPLFKKFTLKTHPQQSETT